MEQDLGVLVTAEFGTPYDSAIKFGSDVDFIFLVDGKRTMRDRKIEIKSGATEVTLNETTLKSIRAFITALQR
ncbi:MAG: hypothetical protein MSG64_12165 [Pyrinomonadaceae bacterium MAG19_C2-C3]|nr:hypothetical protein [Pyrinomonadaceae bacterium MAG19_C2-C3]